MVIYFFVCTLPGATITVAVPFWKQPIRICIEFSGMTGCEIRSLLYLGSLVNVVDVFMSAQKSPEVSTVCVIGKEGTEDRKVNNLFPLTHANTLTLSRYNNRCLINCRLYHKTWSTRPLFSRAMCPPGQLFLGLVILFIAMAVKNLQLI